MRRRGFGLVRAAMEVELDGFSAETDQPFA